MRLLTAYFSSSLGECVGRINDLSLARFVITIHPDLFGNFAVVFRVESYPDYEFYCKKMKIKPISTEEYFK